MWHCTTGRKTACLILICPENTLIFPICLKQWKFILRRPKVHYYSPFGPIFIWITEHLTPAFQGAIPLPSAMILYQAFFNIRKAHLQLPQTIAPDYTFISLCLYSRWITSTLCCHYLVSHLSTLAEHAEGLWQRDDLPSTGCKAYVKAPSSCFSWVYIQHKLGFC